MKREENGSPIVYRVVPSQLIIQQIQELQVKANEAGVGSQFKASIEEISQIGSEIKGNTMHLSRRTFLQATAAIGGATTLALPASAGAQGANERINIGLIGTGGRCRHLMGAL